MKRLPLFLLLLSIACKPVEAPTQSGASTPSPAVTATTESAPQLIARYGCGVCHIIPGVEGAQGRLGPSLEGVASRAKISYETVDNTPENLLKYIRQPQSLNPDSTMPPLNINDDDAKAIVAYLLTLK